MGISINPALEILEMIESDIADFSVSLIPEYSIEDKEAYLKSIGYSTFVCE